MHVAIDRNPHSHLPSRTYPIFDTNLRALRLGKFGDGNCINPTVPLFFPGSWILSPEADNL